MQRKYTKGSSTMHSQLLAFSLGLFAVYTNIALAKSEKQSAWFVGPTYCQFLCELCGDCLKSSETKSSKDVPVINENQMRNRTYDDYRLCLKNFTFFRIMRGTCNCRSGWSKEDANMKLKQTTSEERISRKINKRKLKQKTWKSRLFLFDKTIFKSGIYQLYLNNNSVALCPYLKNIRTVCAAAYISSLRKLVVSTCSSLQLTSIDSDEHYVIQGALTHNIEQVSIDETRHLVIMSSSDPGWCIKMMTTNGKGIRIAFRLHYNTSGIATDPKRSTLYVLYTSQKVNSFTYTGKPNLFKSFNGKKYKGLMLDSKNDILYLQENNSIYKTTIYKTSLSKYKCEMFVDVLQHSDGFYIFDTMLYVGSRSFLFVWDIKLHKAIKIKPLSQIGHITFSPVL